MSTALSHPCLILPILSPPASLLHPPKVQSYTVWWLRDKGVPSSAGFTPRRSSLLLNRLLCVLMTVCRGWLSSSMMARTLFSVLCDCCHADNRAGPSDQFVEPGGVPFRCAATQLHHSDKEDAGEYRMVKYSQEFPADVKRTQPPQEVQPALAPLLQVVCIACPVKFVRPQPKVLIVVYELYLNFLDLDWPWTWSWLSKVSDQ